MLKFWHLAQVFPHHILMASICGFLAVIIILQTNPWLIWILGVPCLIATVVLSTTAWIEGRRDITVCIVAIVMGGILALWRGVTPFAPAWGAVFLEIFTGTRDTVIDRLQSLAPEPGASLLVGLLTGARASLPKALIEDVRTAGIIHMLAISGQNITLTLTLLAPLLTLVPPRVRWLASVMAIVGFTAFTGASPSAVRAAIMGCIGIFAHHGGRERDIYVSIAIAALVMTLWDPTLPVQNLGFQLSFLAILGLTLCSTPLEERMRWIPWEWLRVSCAGTFAAELMTLPWTAAIFGQCTIYSPLSNLLAAPAVPLATSGAAIAVALSSLSLPLGRVAIIAPWLAASWIAGVATVIAHLPFATVAIPAIPGWLLLAYYIALGGLLLRWYRSPLVQKHALSAVPVLPHELAHGSA